MDLTNNGDKYGIIHNGFHIKLPEAGYIVLTGANNAGKSTLLQFIFKELFAKGTEPFWQDSLALIFTDRIHVLPNTQPSNESLRIYNSQMFDNINGSILSLDDNKLNTNRLPKLLLNHTDLLEQARSLNEMLQRFDLPRFVLKDSQNISFNDVAVHFQGSGLRSLFYILSALTDPGLRCILIDEPELALEPRLQRILRDLLIEKSDEKLIVVATHSNLFLNRKAVGSNYRVRTTDGSFSVTPIEDESHLYDITFNLLGSSLMDLYFPSNYLIVEGVSDQIICETVQRVCDIDSNKLKILSASGIDNVANTYGAVVNSLRPLVINDSPYAKKIVALVDASDVEAKNYQSLQKALTSRLFTLTAGSLEEYIPESLYEAVGRDKATDLQKIAFLKGNYTELGQFKKEISNSIAKILTKDNIKDLQVIVDAITKANV